MHVLHKIPAEHPSIVRSLVFAKWHEVVAPHEATMWAHACNSNIRIVDYISSFQIRESVSFILYTCRSTMSRLRWLLTPARRCQHPPEQDLPLIGNAVSERLNFLMSVYWRGLSARACLLCSWLSFIGDTAMESHLLGWSSYPTIVAFQCQKQPNVNPVHPKLWCSRVVVTGWYPALIRLMFVDQWPLVASAWNEL